MASLFEEVLSVCVDVARIAGQVVRDVQKNREEGTELGAQLKDETDTRTYLTCADQRAQLVITSALRATFPGLKLVGEEDDSEGDKAVQEWAAANPQYFEHSKLRRDACRELFNGEAGKDVFIADADCLDYTWVTAEDLCVFIDPIDGTREFVNSNTSACQTLIGISLRGRATAGVMSLIFHNEGHIGTVPELSSSATGHVIYGVRGLGTVGVPQEKPTLEGLVLGTSAKTEDPALKAAVEVIAAASSNPAGGCANKILQLLTGAADVVLLNRANSLWDTCATEAILASQGGTLTSLHGNPIEHVHTSVSPVTTNRFGAICTSKRYPSVPNTAGTARTHAELCKDLRARSEINDLLAPLGVDTSVQQAADVIRDVQGHYYTCDDFSRILCGKPGCVAGYSSPEAEAVRYKQSYACRIHLTGVEGEAGAQIPPSVFYKRIVLRDMPYAAGKARAHPFKLKRDIKSCFVESSFLSSACPSAFADSAGVSVALPYSVQEDVYEHHAIDSRFGSLLKDFTKEDGWQQYPHLEDQRMRAVVRCLAMFHAFFWQGRRCGTGGAGAAPHQAAVKELLPALWPAGTYWDVASQPADQIANIQKKWARFRTTFAEHLQASEKDDETLGERLAAVAPKINAKNHGVDDSGNPLPVAEMPEFTLFKTVVHGDPKAANFFFKDEDVEGQLPKLGVIDFQWMGCGLGTTDLAYCMAANVHPEHVTVGEADDLVYVKHYHDCLMEGFVAYGVAPNRAAAEELYPYKLVQSHYERSVLDLARVVVGDHWATVTPEVLGARHMKMSFNAYNKSTKVSMWLAARIKVYLDRYSS